MLFGRKKPGFIKEEEIVEKEIQKAGDGCFAEQGEEKPELLAYLTSLPDVEDSFADAVTETKKEDIPLTEAEKLADYIRIRTQGAQITSRKSLETEIPDVDNLLKDIETDESCQDIGRVDGGKDIYYYSKTFMSDNYAMIAALVEDKDLMVTIASMVRFNSKTYPVPTPFTYFEQHPYYATNAQIERAVDLMEQKTEYQDIRILTNSRGVRYMFSETFMKKRYAASLIEDEKYTD